MFPSKEEQDRVGHAVENMFENVEKLKKQIEAEYQKMENLV